jgi:hypothetical protein
MQQKTSAAKPLGDTAFCTSAEYGRSSFRLIGKVTRMKRFFVVILTTLGFLAIGQAGVKAQGFSFSFGSGPGYYNGGYYDPGYYYYNGPYYYYRPYYHHRYYYNNYYRRHHHRWHHWPNRD